MLVHFVLFHLKKGLLDADRQRVRLGLESLREIDAVEALYVGTPTGSERPVVDNSYDLALTVVCRDRHALKRYQEDPAHLRFVAENRDRWERIVVYDAD